MLRRRFLTTTAGAGLALAAPAILAGRAGAQDTITLRMHQFLPPQANVPAHILIPWAERVTAAAGGRMKVEVFSAMALGGTPPQLMDQARDGVVDIVWTLPGYTPGRFPSTEVFELPFMMTNAEATSRAYWSLFESDMQDTEFRDVKILGTWVHGPGVIHAKGEGIRGLEDMAGKKLRGPTRIIADMLAEMKAEPVAMPVPAIPEALSKGVIDGTVIPWEVTPALKIAELVDTHTELSGDRALYTASFVLAMNKPRFESLPDDMKAVIEAHSGLEFSALAGRTMQEYDAPGRKLAEDAGNDIVVLDEDEVARWRSAAQPVIDRWVADMDDKGRDGNGVVAKARALIDQNTG